MLKPYSGRDLTVEERIANYRISRGRRISENILGILGNRWRCFRAPFLLCPEKVQQITMAVLTLHNWLRSDNASRNIYCPLTLIDKEDMAIQASLFRGKVVVTNMALYKPYLLNLYFNEAIFVTSLLLFYNSRSIFRQEFHEDLLLL
jgi:hypothetical protein